jgi:hypothetical protein
MLCVSHILHACVALFLASFSADEPGTRMDFIIACITAFIAVLCCYSSASLTLLCLCSFPGYVGLSHVGLESACFMMR